MSVERLVDGLAERAPAEVTHDGDLEHLLGRGPWSDAAGCGVEWDIEWADERRSDGRGDGDG